MIDKVYRVLVCTGPLVDLDYYRVEGEKMVHVETRAMDSYQNISPRDEESLFLKRCDFAPSAIEFCNIQFDAILRTLFPEMFDDLVLITYHSLEDLRKETRTLVSNLKVRQLSSSPYLLLPTVPVGLR